MLLYYLFVPLLFGRSAVESPAIDFSAPAVGFHDDDTIEFLKNMHPERVRLISIDDP